LLFKVKELPRDNEKEVGESIIRYCEEHYLSSPNMFCSSDDFKEFWRKQVHPHAEILKVDRQRAADAYIFWAKTYHSDKYNKLS
jgi:hypothetical protein